MSELLNNYYNKNPYSYYYDINNNIIEHFDLSTTSLPLVSCVNYGSEIFYADNNLNTNPNWTLIPGGLSWISISNGQMFGVNSGGEIYYASNYKIPSWNKLSGVLTQISFDGYANIVCGVNSSNQIFYADTNITTNPNWTPFNSGLLKNISFSNGHAFGVGMDDNLFYCEDYKNSDWKIVTNGSIGKLIQVSYDGYNNIVCCINSSNKMYYANTNISSNPNWTILPDCLFTNISVSNGHLYAVGTDNNVYYFDVYNVPTFINVKQNIIKKVKQISFDGYNLNTNMPIITSISLPIVSCVNSSAQIYYANNSIQTSPNWTMVPGGLNYVSVSNGQIFGVTSGGDIYYSCNYNNPYWEKLPGILTQISFDGYINVVCGVNSAYEIFYADTNIQTNPNWTHYKSGALLKMISVSNGKAFGIGTGDTIFCTEDYRDTSWREVNNGLIGPIIQVSYDGYKNIVCCLNSSNQMYFANTNITSTPNWTILPSALFISISVSNGHLYAIGTDNNAYYLNIYNDTSSLIKVTDNNIGKLSQISFDGYYKNTIIQPVTTPSETPETVQLVINQPVTRPIISTGTTPEMVPSKKTSPKKNQGKVNYNLLIIISIIISAVLVIFGFIYFITR